MLVVFCVKQKKANAFLKNLKRIISKGSNKKGVLFIDIVPQEGKISLYKGFVINGLMHLGTVTSKNHYKDLINIFNSLNITPSDESNVPEIFKNKEDHIYYILNSNDQERFKL